MTVIQIEQGGKKGEEGTDVQSDRVRQGREVGTR